MSEATPSDRARAAAGLPPSEAVPGRELTMAEKIDRRVVAVATREHIYQQSMPTGLEAKRLIADAATALRNVPDLVKTTESSFLGALMTAAQLGLRPNVPALGHGWILPFWNSQKQVHEAQWILGYQGMIELAQRSGLIASITAHTIYSNEEHEIELGLSEKLRHVPIFDEEKRGVPILHYAIARFTNGGVVWHVLGEDEVERIKQRAKSSRSAFSPWNSPEDRPAMARKSAVVRLFKFLPKSTVLSLAIASDESIREDLSPDAIVPNEQPTEPVPVTVEREPEPASAAPEPPPNEPEVDQRRYPTSAVRKGLMDAAREKHGDAVVAVHHSITGWSMPVGGDDDEWAVIAPFTSTDELRAIVAAGIREADVDPGDGLPDETP